MTDLLLQMAAALGGVLILIFGAAYLFKAKVRRTGNMKMVEYYSFGPKKGVAALKVGKQVLILGITPNDVRLLASMDESTFSHEGFEGVLARETSILQESKGESQ